MILDGNNIKDRNDLTISLNDAYLTLQYGYNSILDEELLLINIDHLGYKGRYKGILFNKIKYIQGDDIKTQYISRGGDFKFLSSDEVKETIRDFKLKTLLGE